jgi:hypothetical protein
MLSPTPNMCMFFCCIKISFWSNAMLKMYGGSRLTSDLQRKLVRVVRRGLFVVHRNTSLQRSYWTRDMTCQPTYGHWVSSLLNYLLAGKTQLRILSPSKEIANANVGCNSSMLWKMCYCVESCRTNYINDSCFHSESLNAAHMPLLHAMDPSILFHYTNLRLQQKQSKVMNMQQYWLTDRSVLTQLAGLKLVRAK